MEKKGKIVMGLFLVSSLIIIVVSIFNLHFDKGNSDNSHSKNDEIPIQIEYPETYELSNVILALTEYGRTDKWEVRKGFDYYDKVLGFFSEYNNHPLLDSVNYSREKWKEYLSFRTDAYAFNFDENNNLKRYSPFLANPDVQPFDENLDLINDFVKTSGFRDFFKSKKSYRDSILTSYKENHLISEMRDFLDSQFTTKVFDKKYKVILSPFVYRMNCHRTIDSITEADFPTLPDYIVYDSIPNTLKNKIIESHTLFTEMDHAYVNPISSKYSDLISESFSDSIWNKKSGYEEYKLGVFNEYMTWAVYDVFIKENYPKYGDEISKYWYYQNDTRGFIYSNTFSEILYDLYKSSDSKTIEELYPKLLRSIKAKQNTLTKPTLKSDTILRINEEKYLVEINFSETMRQDSFDILLSIGKTKDTLNINKVNHNLKWNDNQLSFNLDLEQNPDEFGIVFNWWGVKNPIVNKKNIFLSPTKVEFKNEN